MNPIPRRYLNHVLNAFPKQPVITEKLRESLILGLEIARQEDVYAFDDSLMLGLIAARSVVIPILDNADVDIPAYARRLRDDISGYDSRSESPFHDEYNALKAKKKKDPGAATQAFRNLQIAQALAHEHGLPAIDTTCFLKAIFCNNFNIDRQIDDATSQYLAKTPVVEQIKTTLRNSGITDLQNTRLNEIVDYLRSDYIFIGRPFEELSPFVRNLSAFEGIENSIRFAKNVEPFIEAPRLVLLPSSKRLHLRQFDYANTYVCRDEADLAGCKINTCSGAGLISWNDVEAFESLINRNDVSECDLQRFLEQHPSFLLGNQYHRLHSQIVLLNDDGRELIPDFFAERIGTTYADIIELKKPSARLISGSKNRKGFAAALTRALNQVRVYRNYFDDAQRRHLFHQRYGFEAFRPAITVVIGRSSNYLDQMERIEIEDEYRNLKLLTYDDILLRAKQLAITI